MAGNRSPYLVPLNIGILTALLAVTWPYFSQFYALRNINRSVTLTRYANHSSLNNEHCVVHYDANACEDVRIHHESSTAFLACGNPEERTHWYPPSCNHNAAARREDSFREDLLTYNIRTKKTTRLEIEGLEGDFINHGIDVFSLPDDSSKVHIFAVNHGRGGDSIVIFSHLLGSASVQVIKQVRHLGIRTANGVAADGPLNFYITNDHFFAGGILRKIEDRFGPWLGATEVQYCDARRTKPVCRQVSRRSPGYNGIALSVDRRTLFVGDSKFGVLSVYTVLPDKSLELVKSIDLGAAADNIRILPTTGDPIVSVFPQLEDLPYYVSNVRALGRSVLVPSAALRLRSDKDFSPELIFKDDGSAISFMTSGTIDPYSNVFIGGAVLQYGGFTVCDLPKHALV